MIPAVILIAFIFGANGLYAQDSRVAWHEISNFGIEGKGWKDTANLYDRLPARAERIVRPEVWNLSQKSAGLSVRFITDASSISVRWKLRSTNLALPNMAAAAVSGVDLYVKEGRQWRWAGAARPDKPTINEKKIIENMTSVRREFRLYLPLYNGVDSVEIGVPAGASVMPAPAHPRGQKPVVIYGTSIVQGASASRPGMAYAAILERRLDRPVINLGFSGNGKMESEVAELLTEVDASVYVIDCLPNLSSGNEVEARTPRLVEILRRAHPNTPIVLVENILYPDIFIEQNKQKIVKEKNAALLRVYRRLTASGIRNLHYINAERLIGDDGEATIDGIHPTDIGFIRIANVFEPVIKQILDSTRPKPLRPRKMRR